MSLEDPHVRTLLELCASNGIGTTGLNTKGKVPVAAESNRRHSGSSGNRSVLPPVAKNHQPAAVREVAVSGSGGNGNGSSSSSKKRSHAQVTEVPAAAANGDNNDRTVARDKAEGTSSLTKTESVKTDHTSSTTKSKTVKSPAAAGSSSDLNRSRTFSRPVGKPGLELPEVLFPELARVIEDGGEQV